MFLKFTLAAAVSYLLGSFNSAIIVSKLLFGDDIRKYGSKNAGMTNALRVMGGKKTLLVILGDVAKGAAAILAAYLLFSGESDTVVTYAKLTAAIFVVTGHIFPLYFGFRGGKGVLTAAAAFLFFDWRVFLVIISIFALIYFTTNYVSLSSIIAAVCLPFLIYAFYGDISVTLVAAIIAGGIILMHRANIKRLIHKTEPKTNFFKKK